MRDICSSCYRELSECSCYICPGCGFIRYHPFPTLRTHGSGCRYETDLRAIRRHELEQLGLGLQRLLERIAGI